MEKTKGGDLYAQRCVYVLLLYARDGQNKRRGRARARILPYDILSCRGRALHMENASLITRSVRKEQKTLAKTSEFDQ